MAFNEAQLEQVFVELFKAEGYDYVHVENISRDTRDVILYDDLRDFLREQHKAQGITDDEINHAIAKIETSEGGGVYVENVEALRLIQRGFSLRRTNPKLPDLYINLINYDEFKPDEQAKGAKNIFKFVNQFAIAGQHHRIPDGIVFVNGLPLVVLEFKNAIKQNTTIEYAYKQLTRRYRRDIPKLFRYNAFVVISDGVNNKMGSLFAPYEYFYGWNKAEATDSVLEGAFDSMFTMMHGLFRKERLIDVVHNFIFLPDTPKDEDKIVCRYPQYFATTALYNNILRHSRLNPDGDGKGGTYFGATGCGKSYTMLFLAQQLMRSKRLSSPTIVLITDRTDIDDQLSKTFLNATKYIGDKTIVQANSRETLGELLRGRAAGGVFLTTIQKFEEGTGLLSNRANIICISDEAHRSQAGLGMKTEITEKGVTRKYGFAKYLRDSLPNATYVGFTGTPLYDTLDVFGPIVDRYTMYCFKPLQMHTLIQTISRVNRVYPGKEKGLVVDYLGIKRQMNEALHQYGGNGDVDGPDLETIEEAVKVVKDELDIIRRMFNRFDWSIYFTGTPLQQLDVLNKAAEYVQKTKAEETRFMRHVKKMKGAYDICCNSDLLNDAEVNDLNFFLAIRSIISKLTKGNAPDAVRMNKRVAEMLKDALVSDTVEEIAKIGVASDEEIDLLSSEYMKRIDQIPYKNTKVKLMEQLLKQVIESLRKVNKQKGVDFTKRLEDIVKKYNDRSDDAALANDVIDNVVGEMVRLMEEVAGERSSGDAIGLSLAEKAFFDILKAVAVKYDFIENFPDEKLTELAKAIKTMVEEQSDVEDWFNRMDLRAALKMNVIVLLARAGYPPKIRDEVYKEILEQAENFKRHSSPRPYSTFNDDSISIAAEP